MWTPLCSNPHFRIINDYGDKFAHLKDQNPTSLTIFTYLHQDSTYQAETSSLIRKDADNSGATADFLADTFKHVQYRGLWSCLPVPDIHKQIPDSVDDIIHIT